MSDILSDDSARAPTFGSGSLLNIPGHQVAVKTGTTDDRRDNYAIGYTPSLVVGTWVGNNNNERMNPYVASGISGATPLWRNFMIYYLENMNEEQEFEAPDGVIRMEVDSLTGMLPVDDFDSRWEWFIEGTEPTSKSNWYQRLEVCRDDGRLANSGCRDAGRTEINTYVQIRAEIPEWQYSVDQWVYENYGGDLQRYPPQMRSELKFDDDDSLDRDAKPVIKIVNIDDGDRIPLVFRLKTEVSSPRDVEVVRMWMNGEKFNEDRSDPYGYNFNFGVGDIGKEIDLKVEVEDSRGRKGTDQVKFTIVGF